MKKFFRYLLLTGMIIGMMDGVKACDTVFSDILYDIPVKAAWHDVPARQILFETPDGRIAEETYNIPSDTCENIYDFYQNVLPAFGWNAQNLTLYYRTNDQLLLVCEARKTGALLQIGLKPRD